MKMIGPVNLMASVCWHTSLAIEFLWQSIWLPQGFAQIPYPMFAEDFFVGHYKYSTYIVLY